jgi:3-deoxy-manno-octulosonate cytidylyltransferase (CMP-KDO synthetase)
MSKVLVVIPCRLGSTRLPQKHMIDLSNGKTIFQMTFEQCLKSKADKVVIAVDEQSVFEKANQFTDDVMMTSLTHKT